MVEQEGQVEEEEALLPEWAPALFTTLFVFTFEAVFCAGRLNARCTGTKADKGQSVWR